MPNKENFQAVSKNSQELRNFSKSKKMLISKSLDNLEENTMNKSLNLKKLRRKDSSSSILRE
jgi:hypothetical protein